MMYSLNVARAYMKYMQTKSVTFYLPPVVLFLSLSSLISPVFADQLHSTQESPRRIDLMVRTVMGNGLASNGVQRKVDSRLKDLSNKLSKLQYREYSLLSTQDTKLNVTEKKVLHLPKGHSLAVRPLYVQGRRVGMWLKWKDGGGMKILDTRMHFTCGENMVTGTDNTHDSGIILAISVNPLP